MKPEIRFFAGLWTLRGYPTVEREWSLADKFAEVKRQGFDGIGGRFLPDAPALCAAHGLDFILYMDADASNFEEQLRRAGAWRPKRINVQLCNHDTLAPEATRIWIAMDALASELGLVLDLELHRDTATETPEKAFAIADQFQAETGRKIRFSLDFSHFAVTKHLQPPFAPRLLTPREIIGAARQLHLRPFNGQHAQIPATNGRGELTEEFQDYLAFVADLFALIKASARADEVVFACPENGPRLAGGYALSCFPDVWNDAIRVRDEMSRLWAG